MERGPRRFHMEVEAAVGDAGLSFVEVTCTFVALDLTCAHWDHDVECGPRGRNSVGRCTPYEGGRKGSKTGEEVQEPIEMVNSPPMHSED